MDILLTWVGNNDPYRLGTPRTPGPILSLLDAHHFDRVYLLFNLSNRGINYAQRATEITRWCQRTHPNISVRQKFVEHLTVSNYHEVYLVMNDLCQQILQGERGDAAAAACREQDLHRNYYVYLSPGTPQMQTVWVLLVQSGLFPAKMLAATRAEERAPSEDPWYEVDLSVPDFPQVVTPDQFEREIGILRVQNENLLRENVRLNYVLRLLRTVGSIANDDRLPEGFDIEEFLAESEQLVLDAALRQSQNNAEGAARLVGLTGPTFRNRAARSGIRGRRSRRT